ncbi:carboxypeptidase D [Coccinella septempunctata]|uniref:carboxypeptidase D n=1 Tax=Coccinella septempunctata TaxID=41139 RepID=UPI001D07BC45|nr:carboxypeptidase D [Coccinella septempunctata]
MFFQYVLPVLILCNICLCLPTRENDLEGIKHDVNEYFLQNPRYIDYDELTNLFKKLETEHSDIAKLMSVGRSVENRELWVLEIHANVGNRSLLTPMFKYVANMHGDETVGRQLMIYLAQYLIYNYGKDDRVTRLVNTTDIYLMPSMNPDGYENSLEGHCDSRAKYLGRNNENGFDLNRDFPDQFNKSLTQGTILAGRQPETVAMMTWILSRPFVLSGNLHSGAVVASYPYDNSNTGRQCCKESKSPDDKLFKRLASLYAQNHPIMKSGNGCPQEHFEDGITNGAFWYELQGGMQDFNYVHSNCFEVTFELTCCKFPSATTLPKEWQLNKEPLLKYMEATHWGVKGIVTDTEGTPVLDADVQVIGIEHNVTTSNRGEYWRLLLPGTYEIVSSAYGYEPSKRARITVVEGKTTRQDLVLKRSVPIEGEYKKLIEDTKEVYDKYGFMISDDSVFKHHHYSDMEKFMKKFNKTYANITNMYSIGKTVQGREMWVFVVSSTPFKHVPGKPEFKYVANMHGNEVVGREILLLLIKYLCERYGTDDRITQLLDTTRIHLMPSMNPDGYEISREGDSSSARGRGNAHGVDLNRNFPDQYIVNEFNRVIEPETKNVMDWMLSEHFVLSANLHNGALVANYPYDDTPDLKQYKNPTPDDAVFKHLALTYSNAHRTMHDGKPCPMFPKEKFVNGITNGAEWYVVTGGMQDWNYMVGGCMEITLELGCYKYPTADKLPEYWLDNREALITYMEEVHKGIHGFVRSTIGQPIPRAEIMIEGISHFVKTGKDGDYWRILLPGIYNITVTARGYESYTQQVIVPSSGSISYNVTLLKNDGAHWANAYDFDNLKNQYHPKYHANSEIYEIMGKLENMYPDYASFQSESEVSMAIHRLKVTNEVESADDNKFKVAVIGNLYATQPLGRELGIYIARHLLAGLKVGNPTIKRILNDTVVYIVPVIDKAFEQVWGDYQRESSGVKVPDNYVCNNITADFKQVGDQIMNFGKGRVNSIAASKSLANAFKRMLIEEKFDLVLNIEGGGSGMIYPKLKDSLNPYKKFYDAYTYQYKPSILCGNDFTGTQETLTDYLYHEYDTPILTAKVSCCAYPAVENLPYIWREVIFPVMDILELASSGVQGHVQDDRKKPMTNATVKVQGLNKTFEVTKVKADFNIMLPPGKYVLEVNCHNYKTAFINVVITKQKLHLPVTLVRGDLNVGVAVPVLSKTDKIENNILREPLYLNGVKSNGLRGYVRDNFGHPVPKAVIHVVENNLTVLSDEEGKYALPLEVNRYTINISAVGYHRLTKYLSVDDLNGVPDVVMFTLIKNSSVMGLPRIVFVLVLGFGTVLLVASVIFCYMTCKKKNEYWLLNTSGYFEDYKDYDESKENELFRRPIERKPVIVRPYFDEDDDEEGEYERVDRDLPSSSDDEDDIVLLSK